MSVFYTKSGVALPNYITGQYLTNNGTALSWAASGMGDSPPLAHVYGDVY